MRVAIVEDDPLLRDALGRMVELVDGFDLDGSGGSLAEGLELLRRSPDVLLLDLGLPDGTGLDLIAEASRTASECRVLVLTVFADVRTVVRAIEAGADGYLLKESDVDQVADAIRTVIDGGAPISPAVASHILARVRRPTGPARKTATTQLGLTARETEILQELASGYSVKEVAHRHGISRHTVGDHVKAIYRKLSVNSRGQAVHKAVSAGIIRLED